MKGFNYLNNSRSLEVITPLGLSQIFPDKFKKILLVDNLFERVVIGLSIFSLQTKTESMFLKDFARVLNMKEITVTQILEEFIPSSKEQVLSIFSAICCEIVENDLFDVTCDDQQLYLDPGMPDQLYARFAHRLASHVLEFQLKDEWSALEILDERDLPTPGSVSCNRVNL